MKDKKRLSLCIITKNDGKRLAELIKDMEGFADEIVVTDTGSEDETVEIAQKAGAAVYRIKWRGDSSEAKNYCLDHAEGRWALFLQANETIRREQLKELALLLDNPNAEGYLLYPENKGGSVISPVQSLRLFRNRSEYRFKYKVFERIPDEALNNIEDSGIRIVMRRPGRKRLTHREIGLLEEEMAKQPDDGYLQYMYGIMLLNGKKYEDSLAYFQKALQNTNYECLYAPHLFKCLGWSLICLRQDDEAFKLLEEGIREFPFYYDLLVLRGILHKELKQFKEASIDFSAALEKAEQYDISVPTPEIDALVILGLKKTAEPYEKKVSAKTREV